VNALDEPIAEAIVEEWEPVGAEPDTSTETPLPTPDRAAEAQRPAPVTVTTEKRTTPKPTFAPPAPIKRKTLKSPSTEQHLAALAPVEEPQSDWQPTLVAMLVEPVVTEIQPPPAPVIVEPEPQPFVPPQVIDRQDPPYPARARKNGEHGTVVLGVLVDEHGRVVRVVVEQGIEGSGLEGTAIDAVLRWSYEPATENGETVRAWIKERFTFEP
jgi:protein TonB